MLKRKVSARGAASGPLRVFVGTSAGGEDAEACAVLEASLRRRASIPVEIEWLCLSHESGQIGCGWRTERWGTPWTALRWAVPHACGYSGRAVYLDCTSVVFGDAAELATIDLPQGAIMLARREGRELQTGCLVFDCATARAWLPALDQMRADVGVHQEIGGLLSDRPSLVGALPGAWGCSDQIFAQLNPSDPPGGSLHFPVPSLQPHGPAADARLAALGRSHWFTRARLPHYSARVTAIWEQEAAQAEAEGFAVDRYVSSESYGAYVIGGADRVDGGRRVS